MESLRIAVVRGGFYCGKKGDAQKVSFALLEFVKTYPVWIILVVPISTRS